MKNFILQKLLNTLPYKRHIYRFQVMRRILERWVLSELYADDRPAIKQVNVQFVRGCNNHCSFCPHSLTEKKKQLWGNDKITLMDEGLYRDIVRKFAAIGYDEMFCCYCCDEPTLRKDYVDLTLYTAGMLPCASVEVCTNGKLMTKAEYLKLVEQPNIIVIIDAYNDPDVLAKIRDWPTQKRCALLKLNTKNPAEIFNFGGNMPTQFKTPLHQNCLRPSREFFINVDGKVRMCGLDFFTENGAMGDISTQDIYEIWRDVKWENARRQLKAGRRCAMPACSNCDYFGAVEHYKKNYFGVKTV